MRSRDKDPELDGNRLLGALPATERRRLGALMEPTSLSLRQLLYEPGKPIEHVWFPTTAVLSLLAVMDDGHTVEVATVGREGMVGLPVFLGVGTSPDLSIAQVSGKALRMPAPVLREQADGAHGLRGVLQRYIHAFFTQIAQGSACNQIHRVEQRLARWLLMTHDRIGHDRFPLTQEFMAQMLGVRRVTVTEVAGALQQVGVISYLRGIITIVDRRGLEAASCECYRIINGEYERLFG